MIRKQACIALILALVAMPSRSTAGSYGTELPFVIGTGARASAMGLAGVSLAGRSSVQYFNPAGLVWQQHRTVEFFGTTLFDSDAPYLSASYVHPTLDYGTIGITAMHLNIGGVEDRDQFNNLLGEISDRQSRILIGYGMNVRPSLAAGFNLKIDNHSFGEYNGSGVGLDFGVLGQKQISDRRLLRTLRFGVSVQNLIEPSVKLDQEDVADPMSIALGTSLDSQHARIGFTTSMDLVSPRFSPVQFRFGQEITYLTYFALRFGVDGSSPTLGLGGHYRNLAMDYALRSEDLGSNHRLSLTINFGPSRAERESARRERMDEELNLRVSQRMGDFENSQITRLLAAADTLFNSGNYVRARDQYDMVLLWEPDNTLARNRLERCRYEQYIGLAQSMIEDNDFLSALQQLKRAGASQYVDKRQQDLTEECQRRMNDAADFNKMINRLADNSIDLYAEGRFVDALAGFNEVLRIAPGHRMASEYAYKAQANINNAVQRHIVQARARADKGQFAGAISELERALLLAPGNAQIVAEVESLRERRRQQLARSTATGERSEVTRSQPRPSINRQALDARFERGVRHFESGEFEEAAMILMEVWTADPKYRNVIDPLSKAYLFLGMKEYSRGNYSGAIHIWEKILTIDPTNDKAQRYLRKTREEAGRLTGVSDE